MAMLQDFNMTVPQDDKITMPQDSKYWRNFKKEGSISSLSDLGLEDDYTFGLKIPIVDVFDDGTATKFEFLERILDEGADFTMRETYNDMYKGADAVAQPWLDPRRKFRWIHIPANNMEWVETVIKRVCDPSPVKKRRREREESASDMWREPTKPARTPKQEKKKKNNRSRAPSRAPTPASALKETNQTKMIRASAVLRPEYWINQQRGCLQHCASHPLYARFMLPFFSSIPHNREAATVSKKETSKSKIHVDSNMVLFMPFLHWATSGRSFDERSALIETLSKEFKDPNYRRPSAQKIKDLEDEPKGKEFSKFKRRLMRAFLHPDQRNPNKKDRYLHVRRTLDQFYYSTLPDADARTTDQVVYKFAMKQHERERRRRSHEEHKVRFLEIENVSIEKPDEIEPQIETHDHHEPHIPWDPPKVIMVNQLWMWVLKGQYGDTVITSFPAKVKSPLSNHDCGDQDAHVEGDEMYDSTDIWMAVFGELRKGTNYGQRTAKSALDLAWTIADQARAVFHKRTLHPQLQFIEMFEMEINEITFNQTRAFEAFNNNVQAAHNANEFGKVLSSMVTFQKDNFSLKTAPARESKGSPKRTQVEIWRGNFLNFAPEFLEKIGNIGGNPNPKPKKTLTSLSNTSSSIFAETHQDRATIYTLDPRPGLRRILSIDDPLNIEMGDKWSEDLAEELKKFEKSIENAHLTTHDDGPENECPTIDLYYEMKVSLATLFADFRRLVLAAERTEYLNEKLDEFIQASFKFLEAYTDMVMDDLFDITLETNLVKETKDILDELNIMQCIKRQQDSVLEDFEREMLHKESDAERGFHDSSRLGYHVHELQKSAQATYDALRDLLDLKQKQASVIEARSARKEAKGSADQAETSTSLAYETVKQGWSIMIFTIVTIIFLPLSFFTSLFGMNAREVLSGQYTLGFYSAIMYPASFVIICFSLGLALSTEFRLLAQFCLRQFLLFTGLAKLWKLRFGLGKRADGIVESIEKEKKRRATRYVYKKWKVGF